MKHFRLIGLILAVTSILQAEDIVEVTATLLRVDHPDLSSLSQLELHQQVQIAQSRGAEDLLKLAAVIESGKWASIKRGREFFYPGEYSDAKVYPAAKDDKKYSIPTAGTSPGSNTIVFPNFPSVTAMTEIGASLRIRPTIKEDGLIYIEGDFHDTVFEGLSEEAIPITVETKQLVRQNRIHPIMASRIDKAVFRKVEKQFGVMLPTDAGTSANAKLLRNAKEKYTYFLPLVLGNTAFGAPGKIEIEHDSAPTGPIRSTMMKATMVKDFFIKPKTEQKLAAQGVLVIDVKKITAPEPEPIPSSNRQVFLNAKFVESEMPLTEVKPVMSDAEFQEVQANIGRRKGTDLLTAPSIVMASGNTGKIEVIREFVFPVQFTPPEISALSGDKKFPVNPAVPIQTESRNVGISLLAQGTIESDDLIRLKINSSIIAFEGFLDFGNPVMAVKSGFVKKLKPVVVDTSAVEMPILPFRSTETELVVPNGSHVAVTMIFDYHNKNHQKERLLRFRKAKVEEVKTPRYLTVFLSPSTVPIPN